METHPCGIGRYIERFPDLLECFPPPYATGDDVVAGIIEEFEGDIYCRRLFAMMGGVTRSVTTCFTDSRSNLTLSGPRCLAGHRPSLSIVVIVAAPDGVFYNSLKHSSQMVAILDDHPRSVVKKIDHDLLDEIVSLLARTQVLAQALADSALQPRLQGPQEGVERPGITGAPASQQFDSILGFLSHLLII